MRDFINNKFFSFRYIVSRFSTWVFATISFLALLQSSPETATIINGFIPVEHRPIAYAVLAILGIFARSIKQNNFSHR